MQGDQCYGGWDHECFQSFVTVTFGGNIFSLAPN